MLYTSNVHVKNFGIIYLKFKNQRSYLEIRYDWLFLSQYLNFLDRKFLSNILRGTDFDFSFLNRNGFPFRSKRLVNSQTFHFGGKCCFYWVWTIRFEKGKYPFIKWFVLFRQWKESFWYWMIKKYHISLPKKLVSLQISNEYCSNWKLFVPKTKRFRVFYQCKSLLNIPNLIRYTLGNFTEIDENVHKH